VKSEDRPVEFLGEVLPAIVLGFEGVPELLIRFGIVQRFQ
jgi:hypothetical protein